MCDGPGIVVSKKVDLLPTGAKQRCYPAFIGGMSMHQGCTTSSFDKKGCDRLFCTGCDLKVIRFAN
jgi:hypothetical protein